MQDQAFTRAVVSQEFQAAVRGGVLQQALASQAFCQALVGGAFNRQAIERQ
jgi:hypothetical protein